MTDVPWRPLSVRTSDNPTAWDVHHEGVPDHLVRSVMQWISGQVADDEALLWLERHLQLNSLATETDLDARRLVLEAALEKDGQLALDVLDALLFRLWTVNQAPGVSPGLVEHRQIYPRNLAAILRDGASVWTVTTSERWGLQRVVDTVTKGAFAEVVATGTDAAALLAKAWAAVFSRVPHYDDGYRYAVLAVESAAANPTTPNDSRPTLGKEVSHIKHTVHRWTVAGLDAKERQSGETLLNMLQTLWHNHERHVGKGGTAPQPASQSEAEAALFLAMTLVQWFQRGLAVKRGEVGSS